MDCKAYFTVERDKKKIKVILGTKQFKLSRFKVFLKYVINDCFYKFLEEL